MAEEKISSSTSKTLLLTGHGGYDKMTVEERPRPSPETGEVLVNIRANGINFAELMCRLGLYDNVPKLPAVLGVEGAGDIVEVGDGVEELQVGDKVMCWRVFGLWREYATVPVGQCLVMPEEMTYEEAASIPANYITAYHMLFDMGALREGQSVLVHMAAGGVGTAATQLCRTVPDVTVFGTASAAKHDAIRANGVDHPIDYRTQDYVTEIRKIAPEGVDIVLDSLSGDDSVKGFELLKPFGRIIHFGGANMMPGSSRNLWQMFKTYISTKSYSGMDLMKANKAICGYNLAIILNELPHLARIAAVELISLYKEGKIKPKIDSVWAYEDIAKASARMHDRLNIGKIVLSPQKAPEEKAEEK